MIAYSYLFANGMVMTFDEHGEQMPDFQGRHTPELEAKLRAGACAQTVFRGFAGQPADWSQYRAGLPTGDVGLPPEVSHAT